MADSPRPLLLLAPHPAVGAPAARMRRRSRLSIFERGAACHRDGRRRSPRRWWPRSLARPPRRIPGVQAIGKTMSRALGFDPLKVPGGELGDTQGRIGRGRRAPSSSLHRTSSPTTARASSRPPTPSAQRLEQIEGMTGLEASKINIRSTTSSIPSDGDDDDTGRVSDTSSGAPAPDPGPRARLALTVAARGRHCRRRREKWVGCRSGHFSTGVAGSRCPARRAR